MIFVCHGQGGSGLNLLSGAHALTFTPLRTLTAPPEFKVNKFNVQTPRKASSRSVGL